MNQSNSWCLILYIFFHQLSNYRLWKMSILVLSHTIHSTLWPEHIYCCEIFLDIPTSQEVASSKFPGDHEKKKSSLILFSLFSILWYWLMWLLCSPVTQIYIENQVLSIYTLYLKKLSTSLKYLYVISKDATQPHFVYFLILCWKIQPCSF